MAQIIKLSDKIETYESDDTTDKAELAQINILRTLTNSRSNYLEYSSDIEVYLTTVEYATYIDEIITELNERETATIDGGTF